MGKLYITSNTNFGRTSIIKQREFKSVDEMNMVLVNNWNSVINDDDIVYHIGNFAWDPMIAEDILSLLKGKINFIIGEFDQPILDLYNFLNKEKYLIIPKDYFYLEAKSVLLSHWPLYHWPGKDSEIPQIYGYQGNITIENSISISQDKWGYKPVCIDNVIDIINEIHKNKKGG